MTIRFLQTTESDAAGAPFQAGQIIRVAEPTPGMLEALRRGQAEAVKDEGVEFATVRAPRPARKANKRSTH